MSDTAAAPATPEELPGTFFTLTPAKLMGALVGALDITGRVESGQLAPEQALYMKALLLNTSSAATNLMADMAHFTDTRPPDRGKFHAQTAARKLAPASSITRVGPYEATLYELIEKGDVNGVRQTVQPQTLTITTHPNFSRSPEVTEFSTALIQKLATLDRAAQEKLQNLQPGEQPPPELQKQLQSMFNGKFQDLQALLQPRKKRTRRDELQETVLNYMPIMMQGVSEQVKLFKQRRSTLMDTRAGSHNQMSQLVQDVNKEPKIITGKVNYGHAVPDERLEDGVDLHTLVKADPQLSIFKLKGNKLFHGEALAHEFKATEYPDLLKEIKSGGYSHLVPFLYQVKNANQLYFGDMLVGDYKDIPPGDDFLKTLTARIKADHPDAVGTKFSFATVSTAEKTFSNVKQLDAVAETMPKFNSWFIDGDGKRTVHVYDAEYAIPAIKRKTLEQYLDLMKELKRVRHGQIGYDEQSGAPLFDINKWEHTLTSAIADLAKLEKTAADRMDAFNELHRARAEYEADTYKGKYATAYAEAQNKARAASQAYLDVRSADLKRRDSIEHPSALKYDFSKKLCEDLGAALGQVYEGKAELGNTHRDVAEDLYLKAKAYGDFAIKLQRRENANEYRTTLKYLIKYNEEVRTAVSGIMTEKFRTNDKYNKKFVDETGKYVGITPDYLLQRIEQFYEQRRNVPSDTEFLLAAAEAFAEHAIRTNPDDFEKKSVYKTYQKLAWKLEQSQDRKARNTDEYLITPLEQTSEFVALDDLGFFNMARLTPEAFGGFVVAEYGQPPIEVLRTNKPELIRDEVIKGSRIDTLLQIAFAHGMGAISKGTEKHKRASVKIIPLHEDPSTLRYAPDAQDALRDTGEYHDKDGKNFIDEYLRHYLELDTLTPEKVEKEKALRCIDTIKFDSAEKQNAYEPPLLTAYTDLKRVGCSEAEMVKAGLNPEELKHTYLLLGPDDMEACSDNSKRASIIGAELAEQSVRDKLIETSKTKYAITIGDKKYLIRKPKYYGQGGAIARATEIPLDTVQATIQGEHQYAFVPQSLAHKMYHYMMGRLYLTGEAARGEMPSEALYEIATGKPMPPRGMDNPEEQQRYWAGSIQRPGHSGNALGLPGTGLTPEDQELLYKTIDERINSTRDDTRYDAFLIKYGEQTVNYSNRPDARGKDDPTFNSQRAIGVAQAESGIFSNIIGLARLFDVGVIGDAKNVVHPDNVKQVRKWMEKDYSLQQRLTAGALMVNYVNLKEKWARGGIEYNAANNTVTKFTGKGDNKKSSGPVPLQTLLEAHKDGMGYTDKGGKPEGAQCEAGGVTFDGADLVMAYLTQQHQKLVQGLRAVFTNGRAPKDNGENGILLDLFDPAHQETISATKHLFDHILEQFTATKDVPKNAKDPEWLAENEKAVKNRELLAGAYHLIFESGGNIFPASHLMEKGLSEKGSFAMGA